MPAKVVDASTVAAFAFRESRHEEAKNVLTDSELRAPSLLPYELASIAKNKIIAHTEEAPELIKAFRMALALPIQLYEVEQTEVLRTAIESNISTYDACYLYLAKKLGVSLVTFDKQLAKAARLHNVKL